MPINDREYLREKHPPACTCVQCENIRLGKVKEGEVIEDYCSLHKRYYTKDLGCQLCYLEGIAKATDGKIKIQGKEGKEEIAIGLLLLVVGGIVTGITYSVASRGGFYI